MILIVEDSEPLARIYCNSLRTNGFESDYVCSGRDALAFLRLRTPSIVLIDLGLPDMHGVRLLEEMMREGYNGHAIAMSGALDIVDKTKLVEFEIVLEKPLRLAELIEAMTKFQERESEK